MQRKLLRFICVDFDSTGQLLIIYSVFVKQLRINGSTMKQFISYLGSQETYDSLRRKVELFELCMVIQLYNENQQNAQLSH